MEVWKPIPGYGGHYEASSDGRIRRNGKVRRLCVDKKGYYRVTLSHKSKVTNCLVSALVCVAFHGPRPKGYEAAHKNGIKSDNSADNLEWKTHAANIADKFLHGTTRKGSLNPSAKLDEPTVAEVRRVYKPRCPVNGVRALARRLGVAPATISMAINHSWGATSAI